MGTLRTRAARIAALAAPLAVLGLLTAAVPASASVRTPAAPATPGWHKLFGINGWASADGIYHTGAPRYGIQHGIVYLSGSVRNGSSNTSELFAMLPPQARPNHVLYLSVYTLDGSFGSMEIQPNGKMTVWGTPISNSRGYTSLTGISFPLKSVPQTKLHLLNGWVSRQNRWKSGDPSFAVGDGVVYLSGSLHNNGTAQQFAVLPKADRPSRNLYLEVYTYLGTSGGLRIQTDGKMYAYSGSSANFTSLAGISFPLSATGAHKFHLVNGWISSGSIWGTGAPAITISNGVVYLSGSLKQASEFTSQRFAVLPAADRPPHWLYLKTYSWGGAIAELEISPSGDMWMFSPTPADSQNFASLAGLSFPVGS
jgi:hypothetical protein